MIIKRSLLIFSLLVALVSLNAQVEERITPDKDKSREKLSFSERLVFGGDIGLSFGSITYIKLAPVVGYRLTSRLTAGLGPIYIYERYKELNWETSIYGGKLFSSFTIYKGADRENAFGLGNILVHIENEVVNVERYDSPQGERIWIDNLLLGGGLYQPIGGRFGISVFILWDVTQNIYSPYYSNNPIFKFGVNF